MAVLQNIASKQFSYFQKNKTMPEVEDSSYYLYSFPTENLLRIFNYLTPKQLATCREVCLRWKQIIDDLSRLDKLWRKYCEHDFSSICKIARYKAKPELLWCNIYRSLTLWSRLQYAREIRDEFASASRVSEEIQDFKVLTDGVIGVHTRSGIVYYDIETLERAKRGSLSGSYLRYMENNDSLIFMSGDFHLFIIRKFMTRPRQEADVTFDNVKMFLLHDSYLYFITLNDEIHVCNLNESNLNSEYLNTFNNGVMSLGFSDNLNILTYERDIYSLVGKELILRCNVESVANLLHEFRKYNLLEHLDWRIYFHWMFFMNHSLPQGPLRDILIIHTYGEVVFVGTNWGVLRIYYKPYVNDEFDLFNSEPIKQYNFMERSDCPVLTMSPIIQIDVVEMVDGHKVFVAMPKKVAVLNFSHISKAETTALLPYREVKDVKINIQ